MFFNFDVRDSRDDGCKDWFLGARSTFLLDELNSSLVFFLPILKILFLSLSNESHLKKINIKN